MLRGNSLAFLNRQFREPGAQFIVVYTKRRVGKTELVKQFFADKPKPNWNRKDVLSRVKGLNLKIRIWCATHAGRAGCAIPASAWTTLDGRHSA
ncbi:MAG: hypothetical protein AB1649_23825, partial [Chloroflexota bacterium]